jgi:hypothetical protein
MARLGEGLELVRIGAPQRPEFAAWRYGDQFGRRRKRAYLYGAGAAVVLGGIVIGGAATGVIGGAMLGQSGNLVNLVVNMRTLVKLRTDDGRTLKFNNLQLAKVRVLPEEATQGITVHIGSGKKAEVFEGAEAERVFSQIVPGLNSAGGSRSKVQEAVRQIEEIGGPAAYFDHAIRNAHINRKARTKGKPGQLSAFPTATRLALEMALHEERERRALEGELRLLEVAWREAEEVAAISDDLLLPPGAQSLLESRDRHGTDAGGLTLTG